MVWVFCADLFLPRCSGSTIQDPDHFEWHQRCVGETLWGRTYPKLFPVHYLQTSFYTIIFTGYIIELRWCNRIECISKVKLYDLYGKINFTFADSWGCDLPSFTLTCIMKPLELYEKLCQFEALLLITS